jgi:hypothetical protein
MDDKPWLVSLNEAVSAKQKDKLDRRAERIVATAYAEACKEWARAPQAFDVALEAYRKHYPHIPPHLAGRAVADILARQEAGAVGMEHL